MQTCEAEYASCFKFMLGGSAGVDDGCLLLPRRRPCGNTGAGFGAWLQQFGAVARKRGISQSTINRAFAGVTYNKRVIRLDRSQRSFKQSFATFYKRRASAYTQKRARARMKRHARLLARIEKRFGVPPAVVVSIWGLETNFGAGGGKDVDRSVVGNAGLRLSALEVLPP